MRNKCNISQLPLGCQAASNQAAELAAAAAAAETQPAQQEAPAQDQPKQYLYEPRFGLPVVRNYLSYGDLLREIRTEKVQELKFFCAQDDVIELEGPCLVVFRDGTLAQSYVPSFDYRIPYAMENHGVAAIRLPAEPSPGTFTVRRLWNKNQQKIISRVIPVVAIAVVYFATQLAAKWKVQFSFCCCHKTVQFASSLQGGIKPELET